MPAAHVLLAALRLFVAFLLITVSIFLGWFLAWKLILVHIPLVQDLFGLRKKPKEPRPSTRQLTRLFNDSPPQAFHRLDSMGVTKVS